MTISNIVYDYHRNGCDGAGFYVCRFDDSDNGPMVAVLFPTGEDEAGLPLFAWQDGDQCAVFNREQLGAGDIAFGRNSWRGDQYGRTLGEHIRRQTKADYDWDHALRVARACGWGDERPVWSYERRRVAVEAAR